MSVLSCVCSARDPDLQRSLELLLFSVIATTLFVFTVIYSVLLCVAVLAVGFCCVVSALFLVHAGPDVLSCLISVVCSCCYVF